MPKKLTYEFVKEQIESIKGYKLLSIEYINSYSKLIIKCPIGHKFKMSWSNFNSGQKCPECNRLSKCLNIEDLKKKILIIAPGYKLISTKYINANSKLKFKCNRNHKFRMNWDSFSQGRRCPECYNELKFLNLEDLKKQVSKISYELLSTKYINNHTKLKFKCDKGHIFKMSWSGFQQGKRCLECFYKSLRKNYTVEELNQLDKYRKNIINLSNINYRKYKNVINPNNLKRYGGKYHLDHIFSIMEGFRRDIPAKYISNPNNLQMLWWKKNIIKKDTCWQSEKKLYQGYTKFKLSQDDLYEHT